MTEDDLKAVLAKYQQKTFELYNKNIVLETQVETLTSTLESLKIENENLKKSKRQNKEDKDFQ